jgi:hypothetical protein
METPLVGVMPSKHSSHASSSDSDPDFFFPLSSEEAPDQIHMEQLKI